MPDSETLGLFVTASLVLLLIPGPAVLYIVTRSVTQGTAAGLVSSLGLTLGSIVYIAAVALGVSALLLSSAVAFHIIRLAGAGYLVLLGIQKLLRRRDSGAVAAKPESLRRVFLDGLVINLLNPKSVVFFFAFLPQFIRPDRGSPVKQVFLLGAIFVILGFMTDGMYAVLAGRLRHWMAAAMNRDLWQRYVPGSVFILLGLAAALASRE